MQNFASGGWGLSPQTPIGLQRLRTPPPDPQTQPPIANFWLRACPWSTLGATEADSGSKIMTDCIVVFIKENRLCRGAVLERKLVFVFREK